MSDYQAVRSSREISKCFFDCLEEIDPIQYGGRNRSRMIRNINDYLQGRNDMPLEELMEWAAKAQGGEYAARIQNLRQSIQDFQVQKALLNTPYTKTSGKQYQYQTMDLDPNQPLKVIDQKTYDMAAKEGFPPRFFQESYFDHVTFYCLPDNANCDFSRFHNCTFAVCRLAGVRFWKASLYSCEFHSCQIKFTLFPDTSLSDTHFCDCFIHSAAFLRSRLKHCNTIDCTVGRLNFNGALLDGCTYARITRLSNSKIEAMETALFTMSGGTDEEARANRAAIFRALRVPEQKETARLPGQER